MTWLLYYIAGLILLVILFLARDILKELIIEYFKRLVFKEKVPRKIENKKNQIQIIFKNEFKAGTINIYNEWENDFIVRENEEYTTKDNKFYLNANNEEFDSMYFIKSVECIFPSLNRLLNKEAKTGLQIYLAYKMAYKNNKLNIVNFIETALNRIITLNKEYVNYKKWFYIFKELDLEGNLEGLIVPLSKDIGKVNEDLINKFTSFINSISQNKRIKYPLNLGNIRLGIIKIGTKAKILPNYFYFLAYLKKAGCNKIIICGRGSWEKIVRTLSKMAIVAFELKEEMIVKQMYPSMKKLISNEPVCSVICSHLNKINP